MMAGFQCQLGAPCKGGDLMNRRRVSWTKEAAPNGPLGQCIGIVSSCRPILTRIEFTVSLGYYSHPRLILFRSHAMRNLLLKEINSYRCVAICIVLSCIGWVLYWVSDSKNFRLNAEAWHILNKNESTSVCEWSSRPKKSPGTSFRVSLLFNLNQSCVKIGRAQQLIPDFNGELCWHTVFFCFVIGVFAINQRNFLIILVIFRFRNGQNLQMVETFSRKGCKKGWYIYIQLLAHLFRWNMPDKFVQYFLSRKISATYWQFNAHCRQFASRELKWFFCFAPNSLNQKVL
jgi:hypothetical protein